MAKSNYILSILLCATFLICAHVEFYPLRREYKVSGIKDKDTWAVGMKVAGLQEKSIDKVVLVKRIYTSEIGVREVGTNAGKQVESYLRYVGLKKGEPWCAAFVCWVFGRAGVENPRTGWSPSLFPTSKVIWTRGGNKLSIAGSPAPNSINELNKIPKTKFRTQPITHNPIAIGSQPSSGDVFGNYFPEKNRIAHVGFIDSWDGKWLITVEGNTNESGSREGDGVYRKRRLVSSIYKVARYINLGRREDL